MKPQYYPRNDYCVIQVNEIGETPSGIAMPDYSVQGKEFIVVAMGNSVEDLDIGDRVLMLGNQGVTYFPLPNSKNLIVIKQEHIVLVIEEA